MSEGGQTIGNGDADAANGVARSYTIASNRSSASTQPSLRKKDPVISPATPTDQEQVVARQAVAVEMMSW